MKRLRGSQQYFVWSLGVVSLPWLWQDSYKFLPAKAGMIRYKAYANDITTNG